MCIRDSATVQPQPSTDAWDRWGIQKVSQDDDWTRHFRIGAMVGLLSLIHISFNIERRTSNWGKERLKAEGLKTWQIERNPVLRFFHKL